MRILNKHIALSITLLAPVVGMMTPQAVYAESVDSTVYTYIQEFFTAANNFDNGYTISGLYYAVLDICQSSDDELATEWKQIDLINATTHENPIATLDQASDFLIRIKDLISENGTAAIPQAKDDIISQLQETTGWEFVDRLLFSNDQAIITHYEHAGWNALVAQLRTLAQGTKLDSIAQDIPRTDEYQSYGTASGPSYTISARRMQEIQSKLDKHKDLFPQVMQRKKDDKKVKKQVQSRLQKVVLSG